MEREWSRTVEGIIMKYKTPKKPPLNKRYDTKPQQDYSYGLAKVVAEACDVWLEKRGMKSLAWKDQKQKSKLNEEKDSH